MKDFVSIKIWSDWNFDVTDPRVYSTHYNGGLQPKYLQTELADIGNRLYRIQLGLLDLLVWQGLSTAHFFFLIERIKCLQTFRI